MRLLRIATYLSLLAWLAVPASGGNERPGQAVWVEAADGFKLHARFHDAGSRASAVLLLHQCDREGPATGFERLASILVERGAHALEVDLRGYGLSVDERFDGENWQEAGSHFSSDVASLFDYLAARPDVDATRLAILGASCGGRYAAELARTQAGIRALVLLSSNLGRSPEETLAGLSGLPVLGITSEGDPYGLTVRSTREAFELSKHPASRLLMYKGSAHGSPLFELDSQLEPLVAGWLVARLND